MDLMLLLVLRLTTLLLYAFFFGISLLQLIAPWESEVSGTAFAQYHHSIDRYMSLWARLLAQAQLVLTLTLLLIERRHWRSWPYLVTVMALGLVITSVLIAIRGNVPLNQVINAWSVDHLPASWSAIRDQWLHYHHLRAWANLLAFVLLLLGIFCGHTSSTRNSVTSD